LAADSLAYIVPEGHRAFAVEVDKVVTAGGLVRPGDRVDLVAVLDVVYKDVLLDKEYKETRVITIGQNIEVLAVEQKLENRIVGEGGAEQGTPVNQPGTQPGATVVTLALTPQQAQEFFLADDKGSIRLAVRGPGDAAVADIADTTSFSLVDPESQKFIRDALKAQK
jgi:pilus assembly protein CpaB